MPLSEGDVFCVFCFSFFRRDCLATAGRIFTRSLPTYVFAVLFVNSGTPWNTKNVWGPKRPLFGTKIHTPPSSRGGILGNLKTYITTIGYPDIHVWSYSVLRHLSYNNNNNNNKHDNVYSAVIMAEPLRELTRGLVSCALSAVAHSASLERQYQDGAVLQSHGM